MRKKQPINHDWFLLLPDGEDQPPPELVVTAAAAAATATSGRELALQPMACDLQEQPIRNELFRVTDSELHEMIIRQKRTFEILSSKLSDGGEKLRDNTKRLEEERERRKLCRLEKINPTSVNAQQYSVQQEANGLWYSCSFACGSDPIHQLPNTNSEVANKINSLIKHLQTLVCPSDMYQFWTAVKREDRCLLTIRNQPFILSYPPVSGEGLWMYRIACKEYEFDVGSEEEEGDLGIVGRVFRHRSIETTPHVKYYTIQQYSLRDVALSCGIKSLIAVPVFEPSSPCCIGILEYVYRWTISVYDSVNDICKAIREVGLESPIFHADHYESLKDKKIEKAVRPALKEIRKTLRESCKIRGVHFCQAWAPCTSCNEVDNDDAKMRVLCQHSKGYDARQRYSLKLFSNASFVHHLQNSQAIAGRASSSVMLSLCMDTTKLNIIDYPLAHFAVESGLNGRFAICLQSNHTGNNNYVLEFFFKYSEHPQTFLLMIWEDMKKHLPSFKVASGQELGEELPIIVMDSQMNGKLGFIQKPEKIELVQYPLMDAMTIGRNDVICEQTSIPHPVQGIEERASMLQPSMYTMETNVIQDSNKIFDFVQIPKERESLMSVRDDVIEEHFCSKQASAIDTTRTGHHEFGIPVGMSNMNEKLDCPQSIDGEVVQPYLVSQPSENLMNNRTNNAGEDPNGIPNLNLQQAKTTKIVGKQCRKSGIPIPLEDIQQQFGKKLQDAATSLGVSRSTLKRACREYEIFWWRPGKRNSGHHATNNASNENVPKDKVLPPNSNWPYQPLVAIGTSEMQNYMPLGSSNNVDIKVIYTEKTALKFQFSSSSGIVGLKEQVVKRLPEIDFENYSFQYNDEENDWISILVDEDLHHYLSSATSSTKTSVTIHLKPH